jgi:tetratricopeptide (TPR) repeat protein
MAAATISLAQDAKPRRLTVTPDKGPLKGQTVYTNSFALLVGINHYANLPKQFWLECADKDVLALRDTLVRSYGFPAENIVTLLDEQATRDGIRNALAFLTNKRRVQVTDRMLLYFASHGQAVDSPDGGKEGFLIPYDANLDLAHPSETLGYQQTCLPMRDLWAYVESCPARHSLVMVDACFGGLLARSRSVRLPSVAMSKYLSQTAHEFLSAGGKDEEAWEDPSLGHSVFMYSLLKELNAEAKEPDSTFTAADLYAKLKTEVTDKSVGKQTPQMESYGGSEGEVLFVSTAPQQAPPIKTGLPRGAASIERAPRVIASELCGKGHMSFLHKDYAEAEQLFRQAMQVAPDFAPAYNSLAIVYASGKQDYAQAETYYKKAIEIDPQYALAYSNLGRMYYRRENDAARAETCYRKAIELKPNFALAYSHLAHLCAISKKDYAGAETYYKKAISLDPKLYFAYTGLGNLYLDNLKDYKQAEANFRKAIDLDATGPGPFIGLARALNRQGKRSEAQAQARKARDLGLKDHPLYKQLGI